MMKMKCAAVILMFALLAVALTSAIPKPEEKHGKDRVVEKKPLSEQKHFRDEEDHNQDYDHEAFLGEEDARQFDDLSPEESKEKLAIIYDKIDVNNDGFVTELELKEWIRYVQNKYIREDSKRQWDDHELESGRLTWEAYSKKTYGSLDDVEENTAQDDGFSYKTMLERDRVRWTVADLDKDEMLDFDEFTAFLHPEDAPHMKDIVIKETVEDIDKDGDGLISMEEYIGDLWPKDDTEGEPDWLKNEREQFISFRDRNKDGQMDAEEVREWIMPADYDNTEAEAKHLIYECDSDKDAKLSKEEVVEKYDLFVGSQATDFGEALTRHDEF